MEKGANAVNSPETQFKVQPKYAYSNRIDFMICDSCFWCASWISNKRMNSDCPSCHANMVRTIPTCLDQIQEFAHCDSNDNYMKGDYNHNFLEI